MKNDRYADEVTRPFDPHWTTDLPSLVTYLDDICQTLTDREERRRRRRSDAQTNFESAIRAIVLDLYRAYLSDPDLEVGISTSQSTLQKRAKSHYGASLLSPRSFRDALQILINQGYIKKTTPHWNDPSGKNSRTARYQASSCLLRKLANAGASYASLSRRKGAEGIRLKDADKCLLEYVEVPFTSGARDRLKVINNMLESHWADLALPDDLLKNEVTTNRTQSRDEAVQSFDFAARTVYRVFNNSDWNQGGRFYGAWWMACPSRLRQHILIDGKRTVEVDYKGLHPAMLFARENLRIPDDPYRRCLTQADCDAERRIVKRTFNALLNADRIGAISEIEGYSKDVTGLEWKDFKRYVVSCYPEFQSQFGSGVGLLLQRKDSDLAETVMCKFATMGYACLPVHDSFIVHHELQEDLTDAMQAAFEKEFGAIGAVNYDVGVGERADGTIDFINTDIGNLLNPEGYEGRLQVFRLQQQQKKEN